VSLASNPAERTVTQVECSNCRATME